MYSRSSYHQDQKYSELPFVIPCPRPYSLHKGLPIKSSVNVASTQYEQHHMPASYNRQRIYRIKVTMVSLVKQVPSPIRIGKRIISYVSTYTRHINQMLTYTITTPHSTHKYSSQIDIATIVTLCSILTHPIHHMPAVITVAVLPLLPTAYPVFVQLVDYHPYN